MTIEHRTQHGGGDYPVHVHVLRAEPAEACDCDSVQAMVTHLDCARPRHIGYSGISIHVAVLVDGSNRRNYFTRVHHPYDHFMSGYTCGGENNNNNGKQPRRSTRRACKSNCTFCRHGPLAVTVPLPSVKRMISISSPTPLTATG